MGRDTEFITNNRETLSSFCFVAVISTLKKATSSLPKSYQIQSQSRRHSLMNNLTHYDPATALVDDDEIAVFMADAFETGDAAYIAKALGVVARAKGMTHVAASTGLSREQLYRSFSDKGNPTLKTTMAVMKALGITLSIKTVTAL